MGQLRATAVSILCGVVLGAAWIALIDGATWSSTWINGAHTATGVVLLEAHPRQPPFHWYYVLPAILITVFMFLLNLSSPGRLSGLDSMNDSDGRTTAVKSYVFIVITCAILCVGGAAFIGIARLGEPLPVTLAPTTAPGLIPIPIHNPFKPRPTTIPPMTDDESFTAWPGIAIITNALLQVTTGLLFFGGRHGMR